MYELPDIWDSTDPKRMSPHFFFGAVQLDLSSAVRADVSNQNYSICPRHWYIDATFRCDACGTLFTWTADEQRTWFEKYGFYVDSLPTCCPTCRRSRRQLKALRQEYDRIIGRARAGGTLEEKKRALSLIDQIQEVSKAIPQSLIPAGIETTRALLLSQIENIEKRSAERGVHPPEEPS